MASDTQNVKLGVCKVYFDGVDLGYTKGGVEVEVATETKSVEVDQFGKSPINEVVLGRTCTAVVPLAETTLENLARIMPGATLVATGGVKATGTITVATAANGDAVTINGQTFTYRTAPVLPTDVAIGGSANISAQNLLNAINLVGGSAIVAAKYSLATATITVTYDEFGTKGNAFTLAKTGSSVTISGPTLTGGIDPTKKKVNVTNSVGTQLLALAKKLVLHPKSLPDDNKSEDFVIPRAMTPGALQFAYKLEDERIFNVTFNAYPDPTTSLLFVVGDETAS